MKSVQGRIDALVFSGGIGENSSLKRGHIIQHLRKQEFIDFRRIQNCCLVISLQEFYTFFQVTFQLIKRFTTVYHL